MISLQEIQSEADGVVAFATAAGNTEEAAAAAEVAAIASEAARAQLSGRQNTNDTDVEQGQRR